MGSVVYLTLVCLLWSGGQAQQLTPQEEARVDQFMRDVVECQGHTGMIVTMVRGGQTVFARAYGKAEDHDDDSQDVAATTSTVFPIASGSKHFTGTILGHSMQNSPFDWDTPVSQMLNGFHFGDIHRTREVSLRDLLAHRTGIPGHDLILIADAFSREELMQRVRFLRPTEPMRINYNYNNILYGLAAHVGEQYTGRLWDEQLKEQIWDRLGMTLTSTMLLGNRTNYAGWARGHASLLGEKILGPLDMSTFSAVARGAAGAGGVAITAEDWGRWLNFQMGNNDLDGIVDPAVLDSVRESSAITRRLIGPGSTIPLKDFYAGSDRYTQGWSSGWYRNNPIFSHGGSLGFYTSAQGIMPYQNIGMGVAVNSIASGLSRVIQFGGDILLGVEPAINITRVCSRMHSEALNDDPFNGLNYDWSENFGNMALMQSIIKSMSSQDFRKFKNAIKGKTDAELTTNSDFNWLFKKIGNMKPKSNKRRVRRQAGRPLADYTGVFGNFAYGNVSIEIYPADDPDFSGDLLLRYGQLELTLDRDEENPDSFDLSILGLVEIFGSQTRFWSSGGDGSIDRAEIALDPRDGPYSYMRGLMFADAPPPNAECPPPTPCPGQ